MFFTCLLKHARPAAMPARPHASAWLLGWLLALSATAGQADTQPDKGVYPLPSDGNMVGQAYSVEATQEQTLLDISREHNVGYEEIRNANPEVSLWVPGEGTEVKIPARHILPPVPREGLVINLAELRLYYYPATREGETPRVETYPIGIGREGNDTPLGITKTTIKLEDPAWYPPDSIRREAAEQGKELPGVVPPGPENPLGEHAILLDIPGYLLHGTDKPDGIGMRVSHGCIRLYPEDIETLFSDIPSGTTVNIVDIPTKIGRSGDQLYAQSFRSLSEQEASLDDIIDSVDELDEFNQDHVSDIDYGLLRKVLESSNGQIKEITSGASKADSEGPTPQDRAGSDG
ncbi:L,D-transpeptidase family protein [Halomonas piscis]|uniref:L,D-transpeptidase family protein n=1 Tax=Halomonas piscis TaxID=3031727 RepID=UPI00289BF752|nr:L,D-transpeptidase family protein [Halomonas piscis]